MTYWLMKSEPDVYGIKDLAQDGTTLWDGVRNYQARNFLKEMKPGDRVFFYHSNTSPLGIVGVMEVAESQVVDPTQFDQDSKYYDSKSSPDDPRWHTVTVVFVEQWATMVTLDQLRDAFSPEELLLVRRGNRLSVMPIEEAIAQAILKLAKHPN
ncbi:MAG: EVE domain-containing protein [Kaiparowitsia implicata GSE-PSE-MK54-09C]|jgi:predicted RNA-binding protein with PUA-like domain|nr:EVE domain-containing protein [Kaiparowitsia implicata GSE-PSE-MK54-09C]